ncbi:MAG: efflux RND transporter periplasmic adaptor subunit [Bacteroidota bacterium]|jgi:RND family efflux transporter MFP subunit|nr:efflux RND transporter periplasmic adaptor subunit [Bacteroidota bacterium]
MTLNPRLLFPIGAAAVLFVAALLFWPSGGPSIPVYEVKRGTFDIYVIESGSVRATNSSTVTAPRILSGGNLQVVSLADEGTVAKEGDVLVRFDPSAALKRIADRQTELKTAMADLAKLKAQQSADESQAKTEFESAKLNFELAKIAREKMQFEPEARKREAEIEFERARLTFEQSKMNIDNKSIVRRSELGNLQLRIEQIRSDITESQQEMEQLTVKAPISGLIVYENNWSTGRKIAKGDQPWPGMPLISLPDLSAMQTEVSVNEMDIAKVRKDQKVIVIPDAFPDKSFEGVISSVSQIGRQKGQGSNVKVFDIVIDIKGTDDVLKPGITTTNKIIVARRKNVLSIPLIAVVEEHSKTYVFVGDGGSFDKREVELGERNDNFVVVKRGVSAGESVALRNPDQDISGDGVEEPGNNAVQPAPPANE